MSSVMGPTNCFGGANNFGGISDASGLPSQALLSQLLVPNGFNKSYRSIHLSEINWGVMLRDLIRMEQVGRQVLQQQSLFGWRVKSGDSAYRKWLRYCQLGGNFRNCFNDLIGLRVVIPEYLIEYPSHFRVVDLRKGKKQDDGYRGVHLYYIGSNLEYPIEVQVWSAFDAWFNQVSHIYYYKYGVPPAVGYKLRRLYELGHIRDEASFRYYLERLKAHE